MGRGAVKYGLYAVVAAAVAGLYAATFPEAFVPIPPEKNEALLGDWYVERFGSFNRYVFRKDGTGEIWRPGRETRQFFWGTQQDRLRLKYQTYQGWSAPEYRMEIGDEVLLDPLRDGYRIVLRRQAPQSAQLQ